jgi:HK97 gp10 family phage protein
VPKVDIQVEGLKELEDALRGIDRETTRRSLVRRVLKKALEPMAETAVRLAPDDTRTTEPDLRTSIKISRFQRTGRASQARQEAEDWVDMYMGPTKEGYPQAVMQEFGAKQHPAQPYMRPAWDRHKVSTVALVKVQLADKLKKAAKRQARMRARRKRRWRF